MGRKYLSDPDVQPVVDALVSLFLAEGSVNAVHRRLVAALGGSGPIYPNRLHTMLSNDGMKAVNDQTLDLVRKALDALEPGWIEESAPAAAPLRARALALRDAVEGDPAERLKRVASELVVPEAVAARLLGGAGGPAPTAAAAAAGSTAARARTPDWSFQDDACRAALRALDADTNAKACLVIPTGGGKTRIGVRILLRRLADSERQDSVVLWITHRRFLGTQARRELQRAITEGTPDLPEDAIRLLADRVQIAMVGDLARRLDELGDRLLLAVIDEAHHAAAPAYAPVFRQRSLRALLLTATPNRTDGRPIGADEITYTISYRELFERGVLIEPTFEEPLIVPGAGWSDPQSAGDLADYVVERAQGEFVKTIVVASRVEHVVAIHAAIASEVERRQTAAGSVIGPDDVGYVHGTGTSTGADPEDYLDEFLALPRAILVTTAQMLGEGFDDPAVNAVIVTYPTSSMVQLMQAAGRCLRFAPGKNSAFIVQVKDSPLAYHFEQRWLYQDISDLLRPQLVDRAYASPAELAGQVGLLLEAHRVAAGPRSRVLSELDRMKPGQPFNLLLSGMPYSGAAEDFGATSEWNAVAVTATTRTRFLSVFNEFADVAGEARFATEFLRNHVGVDPSPASEWACMRDMLTAMEYARREIAGEQYWQSAARGYHANLGTTWLKYVTFRFEPLLPPALESFLEDAANREDVVAGYLRETGRWEACVKITLPLGGTLAVLLDQGQLVWLQTERRHLIEALRGATPYEALGRVEAWRAALPSMPLPQQLALRFEVFLPTTSLAAHLCLLKAQADGDEAIHIQP